MNKCSTRGNAERPRHEYSWFSQLSNLPEDLYRDFLQNVVRLRLAGQGGYIFAYRPVHSFQQVFKSCNIIALGAHDQKGYALIIDWRSSHHAPSGCTVLIW